MFFTLRIWPKSRHRETVWLTIFDFVANDKVLEYDEGFRTPKLFMCAASCIIKKTFSFDPVKTRRFCFKPVPQVIFQLRYWQTHESFSTHVYVVTDKGFELEHYTAKHKENALFGHIPNTGYSLTQIVCKYGRRELYESAVDGCRRSV